MSTTAHTTANADSSTVQINRIYIRATPKAIWNAITTPDWSEKYGYGGRVDFDLRPGGRFVTIADAVMQQAGMAEVVVDGEVIEAESPHRLVQTWRAGWDSEPASRLTYEIVQKQPGVCSLTVTHELAGTPRTAQMVRGAIDGAGGGWAEVLSDLKTLLETGTSVSSLGVRRS